MNKPIWEDDGNFLEEVMWGEDWEEVTEEKMVDQSRWNTYYSQVFKRKEDGTFWEFCWSQGSTEYQECDLDLTCEQVEPVEITKVEYVPVGNRG